MHYHIVGIAGAGMSAIANILLDQGHTVSGSDMQRNVQVEALEARGATVHTGHNPEYIGQADALLVTSAARKDHPEVVAARIRDIPILKRADLWRAWSSQRQIVAVAGTHGKTTTTAMIALILLRAGHDPGFLVGASVPDLATNARWGNPDAPLVIEADEYDRTFLALTPHIAVITNVEWDHVDIFPSRDEYDAAFRDFVRAVPNPRNVILCGDDAGIQRTIDAPEAIYYGIDDAVARNPVSCRRALLDWMAANIETTERGTRFDLWHYDQRTYAIKHLGTRLIDLPGDHNVRNALAAIAATTALKVEQTVIAQALAEYHGAGRRFELKGEVAGVTVIDDYAHHPTEVQATLQAARDRYGNRRLVVYLQPHTYSRTQALFDAWSTAFTDADVVRIGDIYAAREYNSMGVDSTALANHIHHSDVQVVGNIQHAAAHLLDILQPGDILLTLGAGDSYVVAETVLNTLKRRVSDASS